MYQTGEFLLGSASMQTVPSSAIVSNDGYDYVMLVADIKTEKGKTVGRIQRQRVTLAIASATTWRSQNRYRLTVDWSSKAAVS